MRLSIDFTNFGCENSCISIEPVICFSSWSFRTSRTRSPEADLTSGVFTIRSDIFLNSCLTSGTFVDSWIKVLPKSLESGMLSGCLIAVLIKYKLESWTSFYLKMWSKSESPCFSTTFPTLQMTSFCSYSVLSEILFLKNLEFWSKRLICMSIKYGSLRVIRYERLESFLFWLSN